MASCSCQCCGLCFLASLLVNFMFRLVMMTHPSPPHGACAAETNRSIVIGDVHGCREELVTLLHLIRPRRECGDRLIYVGDVIGKGPHPLGTLRRARHSVEMVGGEVLIGNHEASALRWLSERRLAQRERHRVSRATRALAEELSDQEVEWLRSRPHFVTLEEHGVVVVHAGLAPGLPLATQRPDHMITMRSIADNGTPSSRLGSIPWATRWRGPPHVIFGHDARRGLQRHPWATGIDTGCVYGGNLTALILPRNGSAWSMLHVPSRALWCAPGNKRESAQHGMSRSPNCG